MKKAITLFSLSIATVMSFAQITITDADMPAVNDTIRFSETNDIQSLDPVLAGANFTWNFSTLVPTTQRVDTFFSVSSTPFAYQLFFNNQFQYPNHKASYALRGIDIGITQVPITEVFNYIKNSSSAYDNVGFGSNISGIPSSTQNIPVDREYEFPMNYNDNHTSNSEYLISGPTFGAYGQTLERVDTVDGWGSLILPNGTYNVLRVKSILNKVDTTYIDQFGIGTTIPRPEEVEYKWLANGKSLPMLKIITVAGNVTQIEYQDDLYVGITKLNVINQLNVFPNPAKNHLIIDFNATVSGNLKIRLKDILGKDIALINSSNINSGKSKLIVNLAQYAIPSGVYFMELLIDDKSYAIRKIIVAE